MPGHVAALNSVFDGMGTSANDTRGTLAISRSVGGAPRWSDHVLCPSCRVLPTEKQEGAVGRVRLSSKRTRTQRLRPLLRWRLGLLLVVRGGGGGARNAAAADPQLRRACGRAGVWWGNRKMLRSPPDFEDVPAAPEARGAGVRRGPLAAVGDAMAWPQGMSLRAWLRAPASALPPGALAFKALLYGSIACLSTASVATVVVAKVLDVHNVRAAGGRLQLQLAARVVCAC